MMLSSTFLRRAALFKPTQLRAFSNTLLVPLQTKGELPAEIENRQISDEVHA